MNNNVQRKKEILQKYQGVRLADVSQNIRTLLFGYKTFSKPFYLRATTSLHLRINNRAYKMRMDRVMASAVAKLKANPKLMKKMAQSKQSLK